MTRATVRIAAGFAVAWPLTAAGADWTFNAGISVSEEYTDNVNLAPDNTARQEDFITDISPGISVRGTGARASADLDYTFQQLISANTNNDDRIHNLAARGQVEFLERIGFLEAGASISRQPLTTGGPTFGSTAGQITNQVNVQTVSVSPSLVHRIGQWVNARLRGSAGFTNVEAAGQSDSHNYGVQGILTGGREFGRTQWTASASHETQVRKGGGSLGRNETLLADFDVNYAINRMFAILAGVGYERVVDPTLTSPPEGVNWRAGFAFNPNPRTSITATAGRRFEALDLSVEASHNLTARTTVRVRVSDTLTNSQSLVLGDTSFIGVDEFGNLIDTRTGLPFAAGTSIFGIQSNTFLRRRFEGNVQTRRERTTLGVSAFYETREVDATGSTEKAYGVNGSATRRISRRTTGSIGAGYSHTDFDTAPERRDHQYDVDASLSYQIFRQVSAILGFRRTQRFSNGTLNDVTENTGFIRIRSDLQ